MTTRILVVELTVGGLDLASELAAALGGGVEVELMRGADRQKLEMALAAAQYAGVHIAGHGGRSVLGCTDGLMPEAEFVTMIEVQRSLRFVLLSACDSYEMAAAVHNALHVPVISYSAPIEDRAAVEFARGFYRSWKRDGDVVHAVGRGREALAVLYPSEAHKVKLINGDMASEGEVQRLLMELRKELNARLDVVEGKVDALNDAAHQRQQMVVVVLLAALLVAQVLTPVISAWLMR